MKRAAIIFQLLWLLYCNPNCIAQSEKNAFQYKPVLEFSVQRYEFLDNAELKNLFNKFHEYCYELETGFRFRSSETPWKKNLSVYFGFKEFNNFYDGVRYNINYLTHGYSISFEKSMSNKWKIEVPIDVRVNFLINSTREYFSNPGSAPLYGDNFRTSLLQLKSGVQFTYGLSQKISAGLFLKGAYTFGSRYDDYPFVTNITAGDIGFHGYSGLLFHYQF